MKNIFFALVFLSLAVELSAQKDYTKLVNPFIGTGGHGHTFPGATMPFGMMQLSPDTRLADWDGSSGYHYSDSVIYGFSHTHLSGTGIPDYCDILLMPFTGKTGLEAGSYRSAFSHQNEKATPGYYSVNLDNGIGVQLTTSYRSGIHQYRFPRGTRTGSVLIDLDWRDQVLESSLEKISEYELRGWRRSKSWAQNQLIYFFIRFDRPIKKFAVIDRETGAPGHHINAYVSFELKNDQKLLAKVGISPVSMGGARLNLESEIPDWDFARVKEAARVAWNKELGKIEVKGGTRDQQTVFYTAMYHASIAPNIFQDVDGQFRGTDGKVHKAEGFTNYTVFSLWDTYRAYHPLMTILNRERTSDWIRTFLKQYEYGGMLPVWELAGNETFCMIGYHSVPVIVDAWQKGIRNFDVSLAMKAMRSYAESDRFGLQHYREAGYISNDKEHESVSKTLEYAYDDWCIAQLARMTGNDPVYRQYIVRAQYYKNLFDARTGHMRGKIQAIWHSPFDPTEINNFFTEGNSWHYSFAVPQDIKTLISLHGGNEKFVSKLEELFTASSATTGRSQPDVTGLIGQYAQGNEPSHHMAYLFNYAAQPWKTQELIHKICKEFYTNAPGGLIGNEDCGQMSAWYIFSAMGLYPVCPGNGEYVLGTPLFDEAVIHLENGKDFIIRAGRTRPEEFYVTGTQLNGAASNRSYLLHSEIENGGLLEFKLGLKPGQWGTAENDLPHSEISDELLTAVPFIDAGSNKFRDSMLVVVGNIDPGTKLNYSMEGDNSLKAYTGPFYIYNSCVMKIELPGSGLAVEQHFYKLPSDKTITVMSHVHPLYTAGGPEALIDGVEGSTNWRAGEWQSYFDQDFEALIDMQKETLINYVGIHVLQDVSPWIVYPRELVVYTSSDGRKFTEAGRVINEVPIQNGEVETQEMGVLVNQKARYIKLKATNGGKLPPWHESAGNGSHLFIDEVIIR